VAGRAVSLAGLAPVTSLQFSPRIVLAYDGFSFGFIQCGGGSGGRMKALGLEDNRDPAHTSSFHITKFQAVWKDKKTTRNILEQGFLIQQTGFCAQRVEKIRESYLISKCKHALVTKYSAKFQQKKPFQSKSWGLNPNILVFCFFRAQKGLFSIFA
jgi:hypothetical protein